MRTGLFAAILTISLTSGVGEYKYVDRSPAVLPDPSTLKVMVMDSGIDCNNKELTKFTPSQYCTPEVQDTHGHGSHISGIIASKACKGVQIIPCKYYYNDGNGYKNLDREVECINKALQLGVNIINMSGGGNDPSSKEKAFVEAFTRKGGTFVAAAGNDGHNLDIMPYYPACYKFPGIVIVGSLDKIGNKLTSSNYAPYVVWRRGLMVESWLVEGRRGTMSGTSQACAVYTSELVEQWCNKR